MKVKQMILAGIVAASVIPALAYAGKRLGKTNGKPKGLPRKIEAKIADAHAEVKRLKNAVKAHRKRPRHVAQAAQG